MPKKSKVESSIHFDEIMDMIKEGISSRDISKHLKKEHGESIHYNTINNYRNDLKSKTTSKYYKDKKKKEKSKNKKIDEIVSKGVANKQSVDEVIAKGVNDLNSLDDIIEFGKNVNLDLNGIVEEFGPQGGVVVSKLDILKAHVLVANVVIKASKVRSDILKDNPEPPEVNVNFVSSDEVISLLKKNTK